MIPSKNLERVLGQPTMLPAHVRALARARVGNIALYALADLDSELRLTEEWVVIGQRGVVVIPSDLAGTRELPLGDLAGSQERRGLSCSALILRSKTGDSFVIRYSHRQRRAMAHLRFVLEGAIEGRPLPDADPDTLYAESVAAPLEEAQASMNEGRLGVVGRLLGYLKPYRARLAAGMLGAAGVTLASLGPAWVTGQLVDRVIRPFEGGVLGRDEAMSRAWPLLALLALAYLGREACAFLRHRSMSILGEWVARDLRREIFGHLQKLPVGYFSKKSTGSLITRASSDTDRIWDFIAFGVVEVTMALLMLTGLSIVLLSLDWRLGIGIIVPIPAFLWAIWRSGKAREQLFLRAWRKWSGVTSVLSDVIPGIRVVKAFHQEGRETQRFGRRNESVTEDFNRIHKSWSAFWPPLMMAVQGLILVAWFFGLPRVIGADGVASLTAGTFVSFVLYLGMFPQPIETIGQASRMVARATSSAHRIFEVLDAKPHAVEIGGSRTIERILGEVAFENVTFSYDGVRRAVDGTSFRVRAGEMIGLVGPSGGGKSTIVSLIARFHQPASGRILVDGVDLRELEAGAYRRQVGMVLQDPYLFHGTILDNIRYGCPEAHLEDVIEAAIAANAHAFVGKLPNGYDTVVGERGHTLSGGERQRISIARAILHNPRILILDEATSAVDTETERKIQEAIDRLIEGRTVFAIAHRLSTLEKADRLFVVENGRITEAGTHAELLLREQGTYRKLCTMQRELFVGV